MNPILFQPELYGLFMSGVFLSLSLVRSNPKRDFFTALALSAVGILVCLAGLRLEGGLFYGAYRVDLFSQVFKTLLFMGLFLVICICSELKGISERLHSEFYLLLSVCTLAMMMLVSSVHLLTIYMALELSSYSLYILVFLRKREDYGIDAGIKYFLIGAAASAVMLFGFALLYGATQAAYVGEMLQVLPGLLDRPLVIIGLFLTLSGFLFKLAVFPFHFWAPDVYEGAPNQVTAYIASASKVGAIAILIRMVSLTGGDSEFLAHALVALAIITMTVGNLAAIVQKDLKRLLAYSSVAQAGYILIGILSMNAAGYTGAIFYALALLLMKFTAFLVVVKVAYDGKNISVDQLAGLHRRSPLLAMALM
ncbi:MAG: NADH-quinone oxidoreductase subunit N, partial [Thermodesulfobacteriota bacterium]